MLQSICISAVDLLDGCCYSACMKRLDKTKYEVTHYACMECLGRGVKLNYKTMPMEIKTCPECHDGELRWLGLRGEWGKIYERLRGIQLSDLLEITDSGLEETSGEG